MTGRVRGALAAAAGALGFLTRVPVGRDGDAWAAFAAWPAAAVVPGYVVGALAAVVVAGTLAVAPGLPAAVVAFAYVVAVYALVGINNLDGVADCGDAMVVHGDASRRREVLADTTTGVGALAAVALVVAGLALGALAVASLPVPGAIGESRGLGAVAESRVLGAVAIVLAAEVGARVGLAGLAGFADAPHDGLGRTITDDVGPGAGVLALALAAPAVAWPLVARTLTARGVLGVDVAAVTATTATTATTAAVAAAAALAGALGATALVGAWATRRLGGPNGDAFGAATEVARVAALHAGVIAWTLS